MVRFESGMRICRRVMTRKGFSGFAGLFFLASLMIPVPAHSQAWSGILDPSRATDWTKAGVAGGIPTYTHVCQTVKPSGDTTGSTDGTNINKALSTCAASASSSSPLVVLLGAGTFYSNSSIGPPAGSNYIVLRGSGPDKTIIKWVGTSGACGHSAGVDLCIEGNSNIGQEGATTAWKGTNHSIGTYSQGASVLDLTSTTGITAGTILNLTQRDDSMGLCPQTGGKGNCSGKVGLSYSGSGPYTVTAITSAPYPNIVDGAQLYIGTNQNHSRDGACGGYQSGPTPVTVLPGTVTTGTNTTFTYGVARQPTSVTSNCQPVYAAVDNGGLFTCGVNAGCTLSNAILGTACPDTTTGNQCAPGEYSRRSQTEAHLVQAVCTGAGSPVAQCLASNEVVIDGQVIAPNYRSSQRPSVWATRLGANNFSNYIGIENLTVDATNDGGTAVATIFFVDCANFWVKNIRSIYAYGTHINVVASTRGSIVDSYLFGIQHSGMQAYGVDLAADVSYVLVQNNIVQHVVSGLQTEQSYGSVIAYNYAVDEYYPFTGGMISMTPMNHGFAGAELFEGNDTNQCQSNGVHGTSWGLTYFRNRCRGQDTPARPANNTLVAAVDPAFQRAQNWVGNVLGTPGFQKTHVRNTQIPGYPTEGIYWLNTSAGYIENGAGSVPLSLDPLVTSTLLRWGNYDVVNGSVQWNNAEIPTSGVPYINGNRVPTKHNLPASFYLSTQPSWWATGYGTPTWPAIGPDVTGSGLLDATCAGNPTACDGVAHMSYQIPAQICYNNAPVDPAYRWGMHVSGGTVTSNDILLFNAANCYPNSYRGKNSPPTNVTATVH